MDLACTHYLRLVSYCYLTIGTWSTKTTTEVGGHGSRPYKLEGHTLTMIDSHRAVLYGGRDYRDENGDAFTLDLKKWV